jgi:hypothetical protein
VPGGLLGHERELKAAAELLGELERGPAALVFEGQAGIGKTRSGRRPSPRRRIFVLEDETVFCLFEGREADVRAVSERAGVPFGRVLASRPGSRAKKSTY